MDRSEQAPYGPGSQAQSAVGGERPEGPPPPADPPTTPHVHPPDPAPVPVPPDVPEPKPEIPPPGTPPVTPIAPDAQELPAGGADRRRLRSVI